jgi:putative heme iron utilization protein
LELERLIRELASVEGMLWVIGGGEVVSENVARGMKEPSFSEGYVTVQGDSWHFHLKTEAATGVQFVEAEDHGIHFLYYVRFASSKDETLLRCYFPNPYLDENDKPTEFQPDKLKLFQEFQDRHVGQQGIIFVRRPRQSPGQGDSGGR